MSIEYDGDILYVLTDMAAWKIVFFDRKQCYKLFHCPFGGEKDDNGAGKKSQISQTGGCRKIVILRNI